MRMYACVGARTYIHEQCSAHEVAYETEAKVLQTGTEDSRKLVEQDQDLRWIHNFEYTPITELYSMWTVYSSDYRLFTSMQFCLKQLLVVLRCSAYKHMILQ